MKIFGQRNNLAGVDDFAGEIALAKRERQHDIDRQVYRVDADWREHYTTRPLVGETR